MYPYASCRLLETACPPNSVPTIETRHNHKVKTYDRLKGKVVSDKTAQEPALGITGDGIIKDDLMEGTSRSGMYTTKASSWPTKKGKMRAADATLAGPLEPVVETLIGRPA